MKVEGASQAYEERLYLKIKIAGKAYVFTVSPNRQPTCFAILRLSLFCRTWNRGIRHYIDAPSLSLLITRNTTCDRLSALIKPSALS